MGSLLHIIFLILVEAITCPPLDSPENGRIDCLLGDDGEPNLGDFCIYICDEGYNITGSTRRTCRADGTWSGTDVTCTGIVGMTVYYNAVTVHGINMHMY